MAKIDITKTELVWPGKYNEDGTLKEVPRVNLPFQVIETVNESRTTREAKKHGVQGSLFDFYEGKEGDTFEDGWKNKLIWGDNLLVMGSLLEKFSGKIDLIYIDPPFATGTDFSFAALVGDGDLELNKQQSSIEEKAYRDTWGRGISSYLSMLSSRLDLMADLLMPFGKVIYLFISILIGCPVSTPGMLLDERFGDRRLPKRNRAWTDAITKNRQNDNSKLVLGAFMTRHDVLITQLYGGRVLESQSYGDSIRQESCRTEGIPPP